MIQPSPWSGPKPLAATAWAAMAVMLLLTIGLALITATPAAACSCSGEPMTDYPDEVTLAFSGRQVDRQVLDRAADNGVRMIFEVDVVYKGDAGPEVAVFTSVDGGMCGINPGPGLVHIAAWDSFGNPTIGLCGSVVTKDDMIAAFGSGQPPAALAPPTGPADGGGGDFPLLPVVGVIAVAVAAALTVLSRLGQRPDEAE